MGKAKFSMIFKIDLNIVHGFMNATFIYDGYEQWSSTINVHSYIYEHTSCMINDHRNSYDHWSSMIIDHNWHSNRSMIVAMECCWSYMISVDQWVISWSLKVEHRVGEIRREQQCNTDGMMGWEKIEYDELRDETYDAKYLVKIQRGKWGKVPRAPFCRGVEEKGRKK